MVKPQSLCRCCVWSVYKFTVIPQSQFMIKPQSLCRCGVCPVPDSPAGRLRQRQARPVWVPDRQSTDGPICRQLQQWWGRKSLWLQWIHELVSLKYFYYCNKNIYFTISNKRQIVLKLFLFSIFLWRQWIVNHALLLLFVNTHTMSQSTIAQVRVTLPWDSKNDCHLNHMRYNNINFICKVLSV